MLSLKVQFSEKPHFEVCSVKLSAFLLGPYNARRYFMKSNKNELFVPPGHFYSPITDPAEAEMHIEKSASSDLLVHGVSIDDQLMQLNWDILSAAAEDIPFTDHEVDEHRYYYYNDQFSYGDACIYYAYLKALRPRRVVEIGSGYTSALALDTINMHRDLSGPDTQLTFVEPYPQRLKGLMREEDNARVTLIEDKVQHVDLEIFESLQANDILFIDSSHVAKTGSDVCFEIFEILPRLRPGVFVAIHDMFYPFEYSKRWAVDESRSWNEVYLIRALLMYSNKFSIEFFNHYFALKFPDLAYAKCPTFMQNCGGSLWLKVNE